MKITVICIKLASANQIFFDNLWKFSKHTRFPLLFWLFLNKIASSRGSAHRIPYKWILWNISQIFAKILDSFSKILTKIMKNWHKIVIFHWFSHNIFWKFLLLPRGLRTCNPAQVQYSNFSPNFREEFEKVFKTFCKNRKFYIKILNNWA